MLNLETHVASAVAYKRLYIYNIGWSARKDMESRGINL